MISIIIPTFNEERALEQTLKGVRALTSVAYELIVADSGSTDHTVAIAEKYADKVVRYEDQPKNAARGRNLGASVAKGSVLAFLDADVTVVDSNGFFLEVERVFAENTNVVAITPRVTVLPEVRTWGDSVSYAIINTLVYLSNTVFRIGGVSGEIQIVRASTFGNLGGYNESLTITEDNDLFMRLAKVGRIRSMRHLEVQHPNRRVHAIGWQRLWVEWALNWFSVTFLGKTWHDQWLHVR